MDDADDVMILLYVCMLGVVYNGSKERCGGGRSGQSYNPMMCTIESGPI